MHTGAVMTPPLFRSPFLRWKSYALGVLTVLSLSGCAGPGPKAAAEPKPEPAPATVKQEAEGPDLPAVPLTPERIYKLIAAEMAGQRGELALAVQYYVESALETRDPRIVARATRIAMYAGDYASALKTAQLWTKLEPDEDEARYALARLYVATGDRANASTTVFENLVNLFARDTNRSNIYKVMEDLAQRYPDNAAAQFALSRVAEQAGMLPEALTAVEKAIRLRPKWVRAQQYYARLLHLQGRTDEAIKWLQTVLQDQDDRSLHLTYARMLVEARRFKQARKQFEVVLKLAPDDADILFALGVLSLQANDLNAAEKYLSRLVEAGDHRIEAAYYLGQIAEDRKDYPQAIRWYKQVEQGEYALEARLRVANLYARQGNLEAALAYLDDTTTRGEEEHIRVFLARGDAMREVGEYAAAVEMYNDALQEYPGNPDLLYARALMAERIDRLDILIADLKAILAKQPKHAHALNALGYTLADRTDRYDEALGYIEQAIKLLPDDPAILDSMGWVQYRLGNYAEAVRYLTRAYDLNNDGEIAAHLGEVLWVKGEQGRARKVWKKGLKQSPDDRALKEVMKRFLP
jgi:tetratricopeptide (TPR) repeat protein